MISPIPTPTPDLSWIAHYLPTRTPEAQAAAVALSSPGAWSAGWLGLALLLVLIAWIIYDAYSHRSAKP